MSYKKLGVLIFLMTLLTGCTKEDLKDAIPYEVIRENHFSYWEEEKIPEQYLVFESETGWDNFIAEIESIGPSRVENLKNLEFDFNNNNLIIIIGKYYNNCCSTIIVSGIYKNKNEIVVQYKESGAGGATMVSQAYTLLKISKEDVDQHP